MGQWLEQSMILLGDADMRSGNKKLHRDKPLFS
jgi:hypothetical protein